MTPRQAAVPDGLLHAVFCFAAAHDSQRLSEGRDPRHGRRAARLMPQLAQANSILTEDAEVRVRWAMVHHDTGATRPDDGLIGTCWDADRLTIGRVGIVTKRSYMSTPVVRADFPRALARANEVRLGPDLQWAEIAGMYAGGTSA